MVGVTLVEIREHIASLASDGGEYYVVCGRTGDRPVPATGKRFDTRSTAQSAARATEQYRTALRRYDPQLPYYDLIVCQEAERAIGTGRSRQLPNSKHRRLDGRPPQPARRRLVEFCHRVAAVVFETLSDAGYSALETAVMDAYFELAETVADPDDLCLCLLESMSAELDERLTPADQSAVLTGAAARMSPTEPGEDPIEETLALLESRGLLGSYTRSPWSVDLDDGARSLRVELSEYALSPHRGRLPVLPLVLDLSRRQFDWPPSSLRALDIGDGWRVTLTLSPEREPNGLVSAPIRSTM
jgi:hypothetical protein